MKNRPSVFLTGLASVAVAACVGAAAFGQTPAPTPLPSAPPPANGPPPGTFNGPPGAANTMAPGMAYGVSEVLKMYQGGISKEVILHYIHNTALPFHLTADNIIYLHSLGMPEEVVRALIERDGQLQQQAMLAYQQQGPPPGQPGQQPPPGYNEQPPPQSQGVVTPTTLAPGVTPPYSYDYGAPYYDYAYPYYYGGYWPGVVVGGWGWGWGGRGWGPGWGRGGAFRGGGFRGGGGFHGGGGHR